jgi:hypothetical protein
VSETPRFVSAGDSHHRIQVPVPERAWRFESSLSHQKILREFDRFRGWPPVRLSRTGFLTNDDLVRTGCCEFPLEGGRVVMVSILVHSAARRTGATLTAHHATARWRPG